MNIDIVREILKTSSNIVFFGGAGVSTESGIPDFRSTDGLYNESYKFPPETILSHSFFYENTEEFYRFYKDKMIYHNAKPNITHKILKRLEDEGRLKAIVTQNIDGLHQLAGSKNVFELHGSIHRNYCTKCHKFYSLSEIEKREGIPKCHCGGIIKPDVVLYEEGLSDETVKGAILSILNCDALIVAGTSLKVYPAAGFLNYYKGNKLILINKTATPMDGMADYVINKPLGETMERLFS